MNKFSAILIASAVALVLTGTLTLGQTRQARQRGGSNARPKQKGKADQCHGKEIDKCYDQLQAFGKADRPAEILKTKDGLEKLCKTFATTNECQKGYIKKCATPLQKELFEFFLESFTKTVEEFCNNPDSKQKFLVHSPCLVDKVFETQDYRTNCVDRFLAAVDHLNSTSRVTQDDRYDTACCGFTQWQKCSKERVTASCGKEAYDAFERYILNTFGGFNGQICPDDVFAVASQTCQKALPPASAKSKGKLSDNPLTQYMSIYFGFLFGKAAN